jgi:hypothetical protein
MRSATALPTGCFEKRKTLWRVREVHDRIRAISRI